MFLYTDANKKIESFLKCYDAFCFFASKRNVNFAPVEVAMETIAYCSSDIESWRYRHQIKNDQVLQVAGTLTLTVCLRAIKTLDYD